jgi:tetratricopeptide (TPR) repeat protein
MDSTEAGLNTLQQAIEVGNETGNTRVTGLATERIRDEFLAQASEALNAQNPTSSQIQTALDALDEMEQYVDPNAQSLFYRARALFEQGQYEEALSTAQEGLDMHQGSRSDAAKYYFIVAESQMNLGNEQAACQTFEQAAYGDYQARAQHYLKNDCQ